MNAFHWRFACALLVLVLIAQNLIFLRSRHQSHPPTATFTASESQLDPQVPLNKHHDWTFNASRDANNYALDYDQCSTAFPDLYYEIDRAATHRLNDTGPISLEDTSIEWREDGAFRALIHNNQLRILETKGIFHYNAYTERALSVWHQIHRALLGASAAGEILPTIEFAATVDDISMIPGGDNPNDTHAVWHFTRRLDDRDQDRVWVVPDFNFWAWRGPAGAFVDMRARAAERDAFVLDKIPKAVWRGVAWTNPGVRQPLLERSRDKPWADIMEIDWDAGGKNMMPMEDFCRYAFVVHTEGRSWSGRLKYLLSCDSVPIVHKLDWTAHYYHLLNPSGPEQNHIPVKHDFANLGKKVTRYLRDGEAAQRIADKSVQTFRDRYLTPAAEACYWRRLIHGWREASFEPQVYEEVEVDVSGTLARERRLRGVTFEEFVLGNEELGGKPKVEDPQDPEGG